MLCWQPGASREGITKPHSHPFILHQPGPTQGNFCVCCDGLEISCGSSVIEAFDFLYKFFWVFNLQYPPALLKFFQVLQFKVYRMFYGSERVPPGVNEIARILNLNS